MTFLLLSARYNKHNMWQSSRKTDALYFGRLLAVFRMYCKTFFFKICGVFCGEPVCNIC